MTDWTHINPKSGMDLLQTLSEDASTGDKTSVTHLKGLLKNILKDDDIIKLYETMIESFRALKHITFINSTTSTTSSSFRNSYIIESWKNIAESMYTILKNPDKYKILIVKMTYYSQSFFDIIYNELENHVKIGDNEVIRIPKSVPFHPILKPLSELLANRKFYSEQNVTSIMPIFELIYKYPVALSEMILHLTEINTNKIKTIDTRKIVALSLWREDFELFNGFPHFSGLRGIFIIGQELTEVPDFLQKYNNIDYLNLDNNLIQKLPDDFATWFPGLKKLIITRNKLTDFPQVVRQFESLIQFNSDFNNNKNTFIPGYPNAEATLSNIFGLIRSYPDIPAEKISNTFLNHVIRDIYVKQHKGSVYDIAEKILNPKNKLFKHEIAKYIFNLLTNEDANKQFIMSNTARQYNEGFRLIDYYLYLPKKLRAQEDPDEELYKILKSKTTDYQSLSPVSLVESPSGRIYKKNKTHAPRYEIIIFMHGDVSNRATEIIDNKFRNVKFIACRGNNLVTTNYQPFNKLICDDSVDKITDTRFKTGYSSVIEKILLSAGIKNEIDIEGDLGIFICDKQTHTSEKIFNPFDAMGKKLPFGFIIHGDILYTSLANVANFIYGELKIRNINPNQCDLIISACRGVVHEPTQIIQYARPRHRTRKNTSKPVSKIRTQYTKKRASKLK